MGVYSTNTGKLYGLNGLGMAGAHDIHQDLGNGIVAPLYKHCLNLGLLIGAEYRNEEDKNNTEICDVLIKNRATKDRIVIIEICSNTTYDRAVKRAMKFYKKHPDTMKEAFIFNFDKCKWLSCNKHGALIDNTFCETIGKDLKQALESNPVYYDYFNI